MLFHCIVVLCQTVLTCQYSLLLGDIRPTLKSIFSLLRSCYFTLTFKGTIDVQPIFCAEIILCKGINKDIDHTRFLLLYLQEKGRLKAIFQLLFVDFFQVRTAFFLVVRTRLFSKPDHRREQIRGSAPRSAAACTEIAGKFVRMHQRNGRTDIAKRLRDTCGLLCHTLIFRSLTRDQIKDIVTLQLDALQRRLSDRKLTVELSDEAKDLLAHQGWDSVYGARPLKRAIQKSILDPLALDVLEGKFREGDVVHVDREGDTLTFRTSVSQREPAVAGSAFG